MIKPFSLELLPRITRAQSMDVLSSQSNLAGYRAVVDCVAEFEKAVPMMMTAAGTVPAAKSFSYWSRCSRFTSNRYRKKVRSDSFSNRCKSCIKRASRKFRWKIFNS